MLGHALVGVQFAFGDRGDEFVVRSEDEVSDFLDVWCDGRREEHALSVGCGFVGETFDNILQCVHKSHIEQSICFVEDEGIEIAEGVDDAFIAEMVE